MVNWAAATTWGAIAATVVTGGLAGPAVLIPVVATGGPDFGNPFSTKENPTFEQNWSYSLVNSLMVYGVAVAGFGGAAVVVFA